MKKCRLLAWGLISALVLNQAVIPAAASELTSVRAGAKKTTALTVSGTDTVSLATGANAKQPETGKSDTENLVFGIREGANLPDNEALLAGYIEKVMYGGAEIEPLGEYGESYLEGAPLLLYQRLKKHIIKIAAGEETSADISISTSGMGLSWTYSELGVSAGAGGNAIGNAVTEKLLETVAIEEVITCLLSDCPYELYWYEKTEGVRLSYIPSATSTGVSVTQLRLRLAVAQAYAGTGENTVNSQKARSTKTAAENAQKIVAAHQDEDDYSKLTSYLKEICDLVSYNHSAAENPSTPYGDPWQLVYVFDGNQSTNVVCEGYSKAFQYLCDLSAFEEDIACYTIYGDLLNADGSSGGGHMWNTVTMEDGKNYLVDVTNCDGDEGNYGVGYPDKLFLAGGKEEGSNRWFFTPNGYRVGYEYDEDMVNLYGETGILELSGEDYHAKLKIPSDLKASYGDKLSTVTLPKGWTWKDGSVELNQLGDHTFPAHYAGSSHIEEQDMDLVVTVSPRALKEAWITVTGADHITYDGTAHKPAVTVRDVDLNRTLTEGTEYTVTYTDNTNAGTASISIKGVGNYGGEVVRKFTIAPIENPAEAPTGLKAVYGDKFSSISLPEGWVWEKPDAPVGDVGTVTAKAVIAATGNYKETEKIITIEVLARKLEEAVVVLSPETAVYTGEEIRPSVRIDGGILPAEDTYTVTYKDNINAGTASVILKGTKNCTGEAVKEFTIQKVTPKLTIGAGTVITKKMGDVPFALEASISNQGVLTYQSSNEAVLTIDTAGVVTIKGTGKAVITVAYAGDRNYNEVSAEVRVTVGTKFSNNPKPSTGGGSSSGGGGGGSTYRRESSDNNAAGIRSVPEGYNGPTQTIGNVTVPDYVVPGSWSQGTDGAWSFTTAARTVCKNEWVAAYNQYADLTNGQMAFDWFRFDADGHMLTGWYTDGNGDVYYLNPLSDNTRGRMITGWLQIEGKWYYFNELPDGTRGKLLKSTTTPDGYIVDADGAWTGKTTN